MYIGAPNKGGRILEETDLIRSVKNGDMQAFEQLFELYKHRAVKTIYLMTGDRVVSEDIAQEAFVTCYLAIRTLKNPEYFKTWFYKILTRTTWRYMKKEKKLIPVEEIIEMVQNQQQGDFNINEIEQKESARILYEEILKLDTKLQTTIILYYYN